VGKLANLKISVIGFGNMGSAITRAWLQTGQLSSSDLTVFDTDSAKVRELSPYSDLEAIQRLEHADVVLLAVKPQDLATIGVTYKIPSKAIIISILAGVSLQKLQTVFGSAAKIVRCMPNLAALISQSQTAFAATDLVPPDLSIVQELLGAFGSVQMLEHEEDLDFWCALLGSGPGFVFYLMQAFNKVATHKGFSEAQARTLVMDLFSASANLAHQGTDTFEQLYRNVASKGGTTEAGLSVFEGAGLQTIVEQALASAELRAKSLNLL
jgi:pyrroline-5-carboxylate reductase